MYYLSDRMLPNGIDRERIIILFGYLLFFYKFVLNWACKNLILNDDRWMYTLSSLYTHIYTFNFETFLFNFIYKKKKMK